jgi:DNA-binding transcriptional LysR family regulator
MPRANLNDLQAFLAVGREGSFTKAAAKLGVSQSALSHTVRGLEERLGVRLLTRTTRSVSPTEAGERLLRSIGPRLDDIEQELDAIGEFRDKPAGSVRISAIDYVANSILWPKLVPLLRAYPDIKVEIGIDYGLVNIVAERYDAGVRRGDHVEKDMVAVRIGPPMRMAVVGSPSYFEARPEPKTPDDLVDHACVNLRLPTRGGLLSWPFHKGKREKRVSVAGQVTFNNTYQMLQAALDGFGLAYVPEALVRPLVAEGRLEEVLADWQAFNPGFHLYYPSRRQHSAAFALVVEALRHRD